MLRNALLLGTLVTTALSLAACGSAPDGDKTESGSEALIIRNPFPPVTICGGIGLSPCTSGAACETNASPQGGTCQCNAGYEDSRGSCVLDTSAYNAEISDYFFSSAPVTGPFDDIELQVSNNVVNLVIPSGLGIPAPPSSTIGGLSGSQSGVNYSANVNSLTMDNWDWSATNGINLSATLEGDIAINLNSWGFGCTTQATLSSVPVNVSFQVVNGSTIVTGASVTLLDHNNVNYSSGCTIANAIGSTTLTSTLQNAIQPAVQSQFATLFQGEGSARGASSLTSLANKGWLTCTSGLLRNATLPYPSGGWQWECNAANTTPAGIVGTCQRH